MWPRQSARTDRREEYEMGLFDRLLGRRETENDPPLSSTQPAGPVAVSASLYTGDADLEVVGESNYQSSLWSISGESIGQRVRHPVIAVLVPEPQNAYDANAIAIQIDAKTVGYLSRARAAEYGPGLQDLMEQSGGYIALKGVIVGGGTRDDGPGMLGVWLKHDPIDFGLEQVTGGSSAGPVTRPTTAGGSMRTGFTEAWLTDLDDDSYDLSWYADLPEGDRSAIARLRGLLATDPDPIDRHFQFAELECRLYRCRDLFESALDEFDAVCVTHDAEMETICQAFQSKWGKVPLLETYRQMAIRQQKKQDWQACLWWVDRGLALYGTSAAREDAVEDLLKRRNRALVKLERPAIAAPGVRTRSTVRRSVADASLERADSPAGPTGERETLVCSECGGSFERVKVRGRKPLLCAGCRSS
jgi:hypothetical protein